jgi:hypothetical protein
MDDNSPGFTVDGAGARQLPIRFIPVVWPLVSAAGRPPVCDVMPFGIMNAWIAQPNAWSSLVTEGDKHKFYPSGALRFQCRHYSSETLRHSDPTLTASEFSIFFARRQNLTPVIDVARLGAVWAEVK